jgi:hypothetical protein
LIASELDDKADPAAALIPKGKAARDCLGRNQPGLAQSHPAIIGIIDGYFEVTPTVWHREILWAMAQGPTSTEAPASALRSAELCSFGIVEVGSIFAAYRDGILADDDEVAVMHGSEELGYTTLTEAMINIRATLEQAVAEGIVEGWLASRLTEIGKALFYKERSWEAIFRLAGAGGLRNYSPTS